MADLALLFITVEHIRGQIKEDFKKVALFGLVTEAEAVCDELDWFKNFLVEFQQLANSGQVNARRALAALRRIVYDAEDVVDTYVSRTEASSFLSHALFGLLNYIIRAHQASKKLQKLQVELVKLKDSHDIEILKVQKSGFRSSNPLHLLAGYQSSKPLHIHASYQSSNAQQLQAPFLHSHQYDSFVGIEVQVKMLINKLTGEDFDVLAIVGMGGIGKTTLAKTIFNHAEKQFRYQAWIPYSLDRNSYEVVSEILRQTKFNVNKNMKTEKCLVVLDDVWDWVSLEEILCTLFEGRHAHEFFSNLSCIKVVITSRHRVQHSNTSSLNWFFHEMRLLSAEDSWDLFCKVISRGYGKELAWEYYSLAKVMLNKCGGLPLAIVTLGGLLKTKDTIEEWEKVFSRLVYKEGPNDLYHPVNDILAFSYDDLCYYLKPCFLYFGLFPEDFSIRAGTLMRMWIAEGFVHKQSSDNGNTSKTLESVARCFLQELIDRSMVQVVKKNYSGKVQTIRIHDIMRELCIKEAQELDFLTVCSSESDQSRIHKDSRRAAINLSKCSTLPALNSRLRSLWLYGQGVGGKRGNRREKQANLNLTLVLKKFKLLRVLDINGIKASEGMMPKQIGDLIHLRYLRIRSTNIRELPKSIGKLRKLETLDYWNVSTDNFEEIIVPNVLWKLKKLRHLYLPYEMSYTKENLKLPMMNLETLWGIRGGDWMRKEMTRLSSNLNKLCIQGISSNDLMKTVFRSPVIKRHNNLYSLSLDWNGFSVKGLDELCLQESLKKLLLMGKAPDEGKPLKFPSNLGKLELYNTGLKRVESMKALGTLPRLKDLRLANDSYIGSEWIISFDNTDRAPPFPALEELKLSSLRMLEKWEMEEGTMPCLRKLSIVSCIRLKRLPEELKFVVTLQKLKIERMPTEFNSKLRKAKDSSGEDQHFDIIKHIPNISIWDSYATVFK